MASPPTLPDGLYTISKDPHSSLQVRLIFQTSGWGQFPTLDSRIRSYDILFPSPVGDPENTKGNLYNNQPGKLSVV
jgi:hypothetical protein